MDYTTQYIGDYNSPIEEFRTKPTRIQWNERGILNTAQVPNLEALRIAEHIPSGVDCYIANWKITMLLMGTST